MPSSLTVCPLQVIDAEMGRRRLLEDTPIASTNEDPVFFDTDQIPWWAWVKRFHLPEVSRKFGSVVIDVQSWRILLWPACHMACIKSTARVNGQSRFSWPITFLWTGRERAIPSSNFEHKACCLTLACTATVQSSVVVTWRRQRRRTAERP